MEKFTKDKMRLSPVELANEILMGTGDYLVVEGETDKCFWNHLQNEGLKKRRIMVANKRECSGNKEYVEKVIKIVNERRHNCNVIGVVDLDYDYVLDNMNCMDNLYYYRYIDLENVLIQSSAFSEVNELISSSSKKIEDGELRNILYEKTYVMGLLRLLNVKEEYNFSFDKLDYKKICCGNKDKSLNYFLSRMQLNGSSREEIVSQIDDLFEKSYDKKYICNGHDMLEVFSNLARKTIATENPIVHTADVLSELLIEGYRIMEGALDIEDCVNEIVMSGN